MEKKFCSVLLVFIMLLMTSNLAFASIAPSEQIFSKDTVITKDNLNEILTTYGLDPSALRTDMDCPGVTTVKDLEKALKEAQKLPQKIIMEDSDPYNDLPEARSDLKNKDVSIKSTAVATVYRQAPITSSLVMLYATTGQYDASTKYWLTALGSGISIDSVPMPGYFYTLNINSNSCYCYRANTPSAYLRMDYSYDITLYLGIGGMGGIRLHSFNVSGFSNFFNNEIP